MAPVPESPVSRADQPLLTADDPPPVRIVNPAGQSSFLLIGDHAGNRIPARLETLGVSEADRARHIAWDIGIAELGALLAERLDAAFVAQTYSRLVVDCNRAPGAGDSIAAVSDGTPIPGNAGLTPADRAARYAEIHEPYQGAIAAELARRDAAGMATVMVALHSFTPVMGPAPRPWQIGVLHDGGDARFARACLAALRARGDLTVGDNQPYQMDTIDHTVPRHCYAAMRPYAELELRQDLLAAAGGVEWGAGVVAAMLERAVAGESVESNGWWAGSPIT